MRLSQIYIYIYTCGRAPYNLVDASQSLLRLGDHAWSEPRTFILCLPVCHCIKFSATMSYPSPRQTFGCQRALIYRVDTCPPSLSNHHQYIFIEMFIFKFFRKIFVKAVSNLFFSVFFPQIYSSSWSGCFAKVQNRWEFSIWVLKLYIHSTYFIYSLFTVNNSRAYACGWLLIHFTVQNKISNFKISKS